MACAKLTDWLRKQGWAINPKRVRRLMRALGLAALYPKPRLSAPGSGHRIYPYRLRGLAITRPNQVWATDTTYIRLRQGFSTWSRFWIGTAGTTCRGPCR